MNCKYFDRSRRMSLNPKTNSAFSLQFYQYCIHARCQTLYLLGFSVKDDKYEDDDDIIYDLYKNEDFSLIDTVKECSLLEPKLFDQNDMCGLICDQDVNLIAMILKEFVVFVFQSLLQTHCHCLSLAQKSV